MEEIRHLVAESRFGYVQVIVADGRIERIDCCRQIKAAATPRPAVLQGAVERS